MPFTNQDYLPTYEELEVDDIKLSSAPLKASAHHLGKYCDNEFKEYMLCSAEEKDPRKCFKDGIAATKCTTHFFKKLKANCAEEFTKYWNCIDHSDRDMNYRNCRKTQGIYDKCVFEKLGQERPPLGYFSLTRVHQTSRQMPQRNIPLPEKVVDPPDVDSVPRLASEDYGTRVPGF